MKMKRLFVYLVLGLALSLLLSACGDMSDRGNVASSPWPDVTEPAMPIPTIPVSPSAMPDMDTNPDTGAGSSFDPGVNHDSSNAGTDTVPSSPKPTDTDR